LQSLRELDRTSSHDDRLSHIDKLAILEGVKAELADKKFILSSAKLVPTKRSRLQVTIGSVVELIDRYGQMFRYTIVDSVEANPSDGRISTKSPLGKRLIGKTLHDIVEWRNGIRTNQFRLVRIM